MKIFEVFFKSPVIVSLCMIIGVIGSIPSISGWLFGNKESAAQIIVNDEMLRKFDDHLQIRDVRGKVVRIEYPKFMFWKKDLNLNVISLVIDKHKESVISECVASYNSKEKYNSAIYTSEGVMVLGRSSEAFENPQYIFSMKEGVKNLMLSFIRAGKSPFGPDDFNISIMCNGYISNTINMSRENWG